MNQELLIYSILSNLDAPSKLHKTDCELFFFFTFYNLIALGVQCDITFGPSQQ